MAVRKVALAGLFVLSSVAVQVLFQAVGLSYLLPIYVPVLLFAFYSSPSASMLMGAVSPLLSNLLVGSPAISPPLAQLMTLQLGITAATIATLRRNFGSGTFLSLLGGVSVGRLLYGCVAYFAFPRIGFERMPVLEPLLQAFGKELPATALQILFVPALVFLVGEGGSLVRIR